MSDDDVVELELGEVLELLLLGEVVDEDSVLSELLELGLVEPDSEEPLVELEVLELRLGLEADEVVELGLVEL